MIVNAKALTDMLTFSMVKTKGAGDKTINAVSDLLLVGKDNRLTASAISQSGIQYIVSIDAVVENEQFPIAEIDQFIKMIKAFDGTIDMSFNGAKIIMKADKTKAAYNTCKTVISAKNIDAYNEKIRVRDIDNNRMMGYGSADVVYQTKVTVKAAEIKKIAKTSGKIMDFYDFEFKVIDGNFTLSLNNEDKGDLILSPDATVIGPNAVGIYNTGVDVIFDYLKGDVSFYLSTSRPLVIQDSEENTIILFPNN